MEDTRKNKLISIGVLGLMQCYLNISNEEAIHRYCKSNDIDIEDFEDEINVFYFDDEFGAYSVYKTEI